MPIPQGRWGREWVMIGEWQVRVHRMRCGHFRKGVTYSVCVPAG